MEAAPPKKTRTLGVPQVISKGRDRCFSFSGQRRISEDPAGTSDRQKPALRSGDGFGSSGEIAAGKPKREASGRALNSEKHKHARLQLSAHFAKNSRPWARKRRLTSFVCVSTR